MQRLPAFKQAANTALGMLGFPVTGLALACMENTHRIALWLAACAAVLALAAAADLRDSRTQQRARTACTAAAVPLMAAASLAAAAGTDLSNWHSVVAWTGAAILAFTGGLLACMGLLGGID